MSRREFGRTALLGAGAAAGGGSLDGMGSHDQAGGGSQGQGGSRVPLAPPDRQPPDLPIPEATRKAGYAIVGLGTLAIEEVLPAFGESKRSRPTALVSGHPDKARRVAETYDIDASKIYGYDTYDRLKADDGVDIVYIILPNHMHAEYTIRALEAGKHVLCEKPMAVSSAECRRMNDAARASGRQLMIAYRLHYEPYNLKLMELCREKPLGAIKSIATSNCQVTTAPNIRLSRGLGGGPVQDTGIYCINAARYITNEEPISVSARAWQPPDDPQFREVPETVTFTLHYASGILAHCETSFGAAESRPLRVHCAKGYFDLDPAYSYRGQRLTVKRGSPDEGGAHEEQIVLRSVNHFAAEMDHFSECVLTGKPARTTGEMGLADLRIIEAIEDATRSGGTVKVEKG